ncbi:MAG: hypothetical protein WB992_09585 [Bryobacteraceae bacterium]
MRFFVIFLIATSAFAQHGGGGFRGGVRFANHPITPGFPSQAGAVVPFIGPVPSLPGNAAFSNHRFALGRGSGGDFFGPYFPFFGDYDGQFPEGQYAPAGNIFIMQPSAANLETQEPVKPPHPVIHEYPENANTTGGAGDQAAFTIALKDGSRLSAETVWVQDGKLHCMDSQGVQQVLSSDRIDRDTTERLNHEKNLHVTLPS